MRSVRRPRRAYPCMPQRSLLSLLNDALDCRAGLALCALANELEDLLQALDLPLGLLLVFLEGLLQVWRLSGTGHLRQGFEDRALGVVNVLEGVREQGLEVFLGHSISLFHIRGGI